MEESLQDPTRADSEICLLRELRGEESHRVFVSHYSNEIQMDEIEAPDRPEALVPPELRDGELFHVFVSYSSSDLQWTHALIELLEDQGLKVCFHERNFTPGLPIMENMSECISQSQKVLLVLSQDFVNSYWCLLEANMSLFRECLQRKPVVPVLLQSDLSIPLSLAHLTYLELSHPDFRERLLQVLCTPNQQLNNATMVPYQPPNIYNGKIFQPLLSIEEAGRVFKCGVWSSEVPEELGLIVHDINNYKEAIGIINRVSKDKALSNCSFNALFCIAGFFFLSIPINLFFFIITFGSFLSVVIIFIILASIAINAVILRKLCTHPQHLLKELRKAVDEANALLFKENILMGVVSISELSVVYVSLDACKRNLTEWFPQPNSFVKILLQHSSDYALARSKMHFPFEAADIGHLHGSVCFCQYVCHERDKKSENGCCTCVC